MSTQGCECLSHRFEGKIMMDYESYIMCKVQVMKLKRRKEDEVLWKSGGGKG